MHSFLLSMKQSFQKLMEVRHDDSQAILILKNGDRKVEAIGFKIMSKSSEHLM